MRWEVKADETVAFPKGSPLSRLDRRAPFHIPDPNDRVFTPQMRQTLEIVDRREKRVCGSMSCLLLQRLSEEGAYG